MKNTKELNDKKQCDIHVVVVAKRTLICKHPVSKRASIKSHGKDFCWECGKHITN